MSHVHVTLLCCNDIYEITPVSGGKLGGVSRLATLRKQLAAINPNTLVLFAGDLYNPSGLGTAVVHGERLDGKQMVAVMNKVGVDYLTFGDHELNTVSTEQFFERLSATRGKVISSNIFNEEGSSFSSGDTTVHKKEIVVVKNEQGEALRLGIFGLTKEIRLPTVDHTHIAWDTAAALQISVLNNKADVIIALTHQPAADDVALATQFPEIDLIIGGDDHQSMKLNPGAGLAPIYKSDSNARNVYIVDIFYTPQTQEIRIEDRLQAITELIPDDPETLAEVNYWVDLAFNTFRADGWEPTEVVGQAPQNLNGFEATIRQQATMLTQLITFSMMKAAQAELAVICSWAIRLDDTIPLGSDITRYDLLRIFSYGNSPIYSVTLPGSLLIEILDFGQRNVGSGWYILTTPNITKNDDTWLINNVPLNPLQNYRVAVADDMLHDGLAYINPARRGEVVLISQHININQAFINQLYQKKFTQTPNYPP